MARRVDIPELRDLLTSEQACELLGIRPERGPKYLLSARYTKDARYVQLGRYYYWFRADIERAREQRILWSEERLA